MPKKPKFKPVITRVKLNHEQAVLACDCYNCSYNLVEKFDKQPTDFLVTTLCTAAKVAQACSIASRVIDSPCSSYWSAQTNTSSS